jgi:hypothetical protein
MGGTLSIYKASPNLAFSEMDMDIPGMGKMKVMEGCDGTNAWEYNPMMGPTVKAGRAAEEALEQARFDEYDWRARYTSAQTKGVDTVDGEACYRVVLTRRAGAPHVQYLSRETGLQVKLEGEFETEMGKLPISAVLKDYRDVGGVLMPFKTINTSSGQVMTMTYTEVKANEDIPRSRFDPPKEVRELLGKGR